MRYLQYTCPDCKRVARIELALALVCPTCAAPSGSPCVDQRGTRYRELTAAHRSRRDLVESTGASTRAQLATAS